MFISVSTCSLLYSQLGVGFQVKQTNNAYVVPFTIANQHYCGGKGRVCILSTCPLHDSFQALEKNGILYILSIRYSSLVGYISSECF